MTLKHWSTRASLWATLCNHREVFHEMARRRLVALHALLRARRKGGGSLGQSTTPGRGTAHNRPNRLRWGSRQSWHPAQSRAPRAETGSKLIGALDVEPRVQRRERGRAVGNSSGRAGERPRADLRELHVVVDERADAGGLMLGGRPRTPWMLAWNAVGWRGRAGARRSRGTPCTSDPSLQRSTRGTMCSGRRGRVPLGDSRPGLTNRWSAEEADSECATEKSDNAVTTATTSASQSANCFIASTAVRNESRTRRAGRATGRGGRRKRCAASGSAEPAFEQLVRADRVLQVRHGSSAMRVTSAAGPLDRNPSQGAPAGRQEGRLGRAFIAAGELSSTPHALSRNRPGQLQQDQLVGNLVAGIGEQITEGEPAHDGEKHHCRQRDSEPAIELVAGVDDREQRAEDAGIDVHGKQRLRWSNLA